MLRDKVCNIVKQHLPVIFLSENQEAWINLENLSDQYVPVHYGYYNVIYQRKYFEAVYDEYTDISVIIFGGGTPVCIWPLAYWKKSEEYIVGSNGLEVLPPLLLNDKFTAEARRKLFKKCLIVLSDIMKCLGIGKCCFREVFMSGGYSIFSQCLLENEARVRTVTAECFVDLSIPLDYILSTMRRTNRYSIKKAQELWKAKIVTKHDEEEIVDKTFDDFRRLHIEVAGRETRGLDTWVIQREALKNSDDFVILLYDGMQKLVGASLYSTTGTAVTYSVAAYKRELFKQPVGHVSQWLAIKHAKALSKKWYYIGRRPYSGDISKPTEKEIAIGHFKEGFATNCYPTVYTDWRLGEF